MGPQTCGAWPDYISSNGNRFSVIPVKLELPPKDALLLCSFLPWKKKSARLAAWRRSGFSGGFPGEDLRRWLQPFASQLRKIRRRLTLNVDGFHFGWLIAIGHCWIKICLARFPLHALAIRAAQTLLDTTAFATFPGMRLALCDCSYRRHHHRKKQRIRAPSHENRSTTQRDRYPDLSLPHKDRLSVAAGERTKIACLAAALLP